jgi:predicted nucleic acid-binding protein
LIEDRLMNGQPAASHQWLSQLDRANCHFASGRRSVEKDLATKHLVKLYEACGARTRFSEAEVRERQKLLLSCPDESFFRAGRAFKKYKDENHGQKTNVLPDFLIGAQAETAQAPLLTGNKKDFVDYFPNLNLICPS